MGLDGEAEEEIERAATQRKRRRLAVRGVSPDGPMPPSSPQELSRALRSIKPNLIQERVCHDPWKIVVATTLLNKTTGKAAVPIFWELIKRWPTPIALAQAAAPGLTGLLRTLGTQSMRTSRLIRLSNAYVMHPPALLPPPPPYKPPEQTSEIAIASEVKNLGSPRFTTKEYRATQRASPIAYLPFTGPYAIDSFRIFSPALNGGGAGARIEEQLERVAHLGIINQRDCDRDDFDETPLWYSPSGLHVTNDEDAEWRRVQPEDKQLRRYLVWRWAIEGVEYDPEEHTYRPAGWSYLNGIIRHNSTH